MRSTSSKVTRGRNSGRERGKRGVRCDRRSGRKPGPARSFARSLPHRKKHVKPSTGFHRGARRPCRSGCVGKDGQGGRLNAQPRRDGAGAGGCEQAQAACPPDSGLARLCSALPKGDTLRSCFQRSHTHTHTHVYGAPAKGQALHQTSVASSSYWSYEIDYYILLCRQRNLREVDFQIRVCPMS